MLNTALTVICIVLHVNWDHCTHLVIFLLPLSWLQVRQAHLSWLPIEDEQKPVNLKQKHNETN